MAAMRHRPARRTHQPRRHRRLLLTLVVTALLTVSTLATGCGSGTITYVDSDYGFSFSYDDSWDLVQTPETELPADASKSVAVFDPHGSDAGNDLTYDYMSVDIYEPEAGRIPTSEEMQDGFEAYFDALRARDDSLRVVALPSTTVVNGQPALYASYIYTSGDTQVRCSEYRLVDAEGVVYSLFTQASDANWERDTEKFVTFLDSFSLETAP